MSYRETREEKHRTVKLYPVTSKGEEFTRSLMEWCKKQGVTVLELPMFLMCVNRIPSLDINYDEAYKNLVERGYLTVKQYNVPIKEAP